MLLMLMLLSTSFLSAACLPVADAMPLLTLPRHAIDATPDDTPCRLPCLMLYAFRAVFTLLLMPLLPLLLPRAIRALR